MKILLLSYFFPPYNTVGAVRAGKMAKFLRQMDHEVRVISAKDQPVCDSLPVETPKNHIVYTYWHNINRLAEFAVGGRESVKAHGFVPKMPMKRVLTRLGFIYRSLLNFPDGEIGWTPFAINAATRLLKTWRADFIYASARPWTSLIAASYLSYRTGIPWVAELRDLWVDGHYYNFPFFRKKIEERLERKVLNTANAFVTVSEPLAEVLSKKYSKPTTVILNGFEMDSHPAEIGEPNDQILKIVHTGNIYEGKRDPSILFKALGSLGPQNNRIKVVFYGRYLPGLYDLARHYRVENMVEIRGVVHYVECLKEQKKADVLLLLLWNDEREFGTYSGKLFEYIGARRPILLLGPSMGVAADLIRSRNLGYVAHDSKKVVNCLQDWLVQKQNGGIPSPSEKALEGLSRFEQFTKLNKFLNALFNSG